MFYCAHFSRRLKGMNECYDRLSYKELVEVMDDLRRDIDVTMRLPLIGRDSPLSWLPFQPTVDRHAPASTVVGHLESKYNVSFDKNNHPISRTVYSSDVIEETVMDIGEWERNDGLAEIRRRKQAQLIFSQPKQVV